SLIEPPGFWLSSFRYRVHGPVSRRRARMTGVSPTSSRMESWIAMEGAAGSGPFILPAPPLPLPARSGCRRPPGSVDVQRREALDQVVQRLDLGQERFQLRQRQRAGTVAAGAVGVGMRLQEQ